MIVGEVSCLTKEKKKKERKFGDALVLGGAGSYYEVGLGAIVEK
jgi:hypothetical protein